MKSVVLRLQVFTDGEWGTLNTRGPVSSHEDLEKAERELGELQSRWSSTYERYRGMPFRIERKSR